MIIFDRMFGTFVAEDEKDPCRYGLITQVKSNNPFKIAFHEWVKVLRDLRQARSIKDVAGFCLQGLAGGPTARDSPQKT